MYYTHYFRIMGVVCAKPYSLVMTQTNLKLIVTENSTLTAQITKLYLHVAISL